MLLATKRDAAAVFVPAMAGNGTTLLVNVTRGSAARPGAVRTSRTRAARTDRSGGTRVAIEGETEPGGRNTIHAKGSVRKR